MMIWGLLFTTPWVNLGTSLLKRLLENLCCLKYIAKEKGMF